MKGGAMMYQKILFHPDEIFQEPLRKDELLFSLLDLSCLGSLKQVGRRPISRTALLRALIFKNLRSLATLSNLILPFWQLLILPALSKNQIKFVLLRVFLPTFNFVKPYIEFTK
jgi:hypothetical protein